MRERSLAAVAAVLGADLPAGASADLTVGPDVVIDSRHATAGALFVALPGERVDGHAFAVAAAANGAVAMIGSRPVAALPTLVVEDPQQALAELAGQVVAEEAARGLVRIAITGSSGKTSTKDLVAQVLAAAGATVSPPGSFNNEIGVPLTALRIDHQTRFLVSEMGARGLGHIAWLCSFVPPTIAAVLNVGHAHLGEFGSVETIAQAKGEIVEALDEHGWAVLNADDPAVSAMAPRTSARTAFFSIEAEPDRGDLRVWAEELVPDELQRFRFALRCRGVVTGRATVALTGSGRHQVANAVAAAAIGLAAGLDVPTVAAALTNARASSRWRMELHHTDDGVLVVNDAYNANPDSMTAALHAVAGLRRPGGRLFAVLGDMLELGDDAAAAHRAIGDLAGRLDFSVIGVGELAQHLVDAAIEAGSEARMIPVEQAAESLRPELSPGDVVLVKASRGLALERVAQALTEPTPGGTA